MFLASVSGLVGISTEATTAHGAVESRCTDSGFYEQPTAQSAAKFAPTPSQTTRS